MRNNVTIAIVLLLLAVALVQVNTEFKDSENSLLLRIYYLISFFVFEKRVPRLQKIL